MKPKTEQINKIERNMKFVRALTEELEVQKAIMSDARWHGLFRNGMQRVIFAMERVINEHVE